ncbi:hypothetical protein BaRGS_00020468 [Batillaria attramentaria]|uniref:HAUS augmin-like complex subunit 8 n=1 Tax=Batillaria attramentaria TaxID=370345 RepID=A0ABD0KM84_9CAEN
MASKRLLYKHVDTQNAVKKSGRRPLVQGRLMGGPEPQVLSARAHLQQGEAQEDVHISIVPPSGREDLSVTPRRAAPQATESQSPRHGPPAQNLDLSDTEMDGYTVKSAQRRPLEAGVSATVRQVPHCLVLDASELGPSPDVVITYERSPITIISHGQRSARKGIEGATTRPGFSHFTVDVDQVPKVRATSPEDLPETLEDVDTLVSRASVLEKKQRMSEDLDEKLPQPNFDASSESERDDSGGASKISKKAQRGERIVPSRYMQSAMSKKISNSEISDTTLQAKKSLSLHNSQNGKGPSSGPVKKSQRLDFLTQSSSRQALSSPRVPQTIRKGKTSTPTHDEAPHMVSCDASAINPELSVLSAADASHLKLNGAGSGHWVGQSPTKHRKVDPKVQQQRLDLQYARYLQWLFLDSRARQVLQQQEKEAMQQLAQLWELTESQRETAAHSEKNLDNLRHLHLLDEQLALQHSALVPLVQTLPRAKADYCQFAKALNTTRHQVHTCGIYLPEDQDDFVDCLEEILRESEELLGQLDLLTKEDAAVINLFATALQSIEKTVENECLEINRCAELLAAVRSLATHENSLRIQAIQTGPSKPS